MTCPSKRLIEFLHGVAEVIDGRDGSYRLSRIPQTLFPVLNERVRLRACSPAGTEIRFRTGTSPVHLRLRRMPEPGHPVFTRQTAVTVGIFRGDFQESWIALEEGDNELEIAPGAAPAGLPPENGCRFAPELTRIVLPPFIELRLVALAGDMTPPRRGDAPELRCLAYGSSITQGAYTPLGNGTYPAVLARELGCDVLNLGFGGGAFLEPELAAWIVSRDDWHFATLELGANLFHLSPEEFQCKVRDFLAIFATETRQRPVFTLDLLPNTGEIRGAEKKHAAALRQIVREETRAAGSRFHRLEYATLPPRIADYSVDLLHPAAHAFESIGRGLADQIRTIPGLFA